MHMFDFEVKYKEEIKNQVSNHLPRLEDEALWMLSDKTKINETFPNEQLLAASHDLFPWFTDFENYMTTDIVSLNSSFV